MIDIGEKLIPIERTIEILHPGEGKEEIGIRVVLVGPSDPKLNNVRRRILNERQELEKRNKTFKAEHIEANRDSILFTAIISWDWYGDVLFENEKPELNRRNVNAIFNKLPWFRAQIDEAFSEQEAFFEKSESD